MGCLRNDRGCTCVMQCRDVVFCMLLLLGLTGLLLTVFGIVGVHSYLDKKTFRTTIGISQVDSLVLLFAGIFINVAVVLMSAFCIIVEKLAKRNQSREQEQQAENSNSNTEEYEDNPPSYSTAVKDGSPPPPYSPSMLTHTTVVTYSRMMSRELVRIRISSQTSEEPHSPLRAYHDGSSFPEEPQSQLTCYQNDIQIEP